MRKHKPFKVLLATAFLATGVLATSTTALAAKSFIDLDSNASYSKAVKHLNSLNAFDYKTGKQLKGNTVVTRAEASKILYNLYGKKLKKVRTYKNNFNDISKKQFSKEMVWSYEVGIFNATSAKKFSPTATITKAQLADILVNTFKLKKGKSASTFKDVKSNHKSYKSIIVLASNAIATKDTKGKFNPSTKVTINQLSAFVDGVMKVKKTSSTVSKPSAQSDKDLKDFNDIKRITKNLYNNLAYGYKEAVVYTATNMENKFLDYLMTNDISEDIAGYTFYGRAINIYSEKVQGGIYKITITMDNERDKSDEALWNKKMDNAKKYIVNHYKLETDYDVVYAVNDFVDSHIEYGADVADNDPYLEWRPNMTTCTGYTDMVSELYKRFGLESRVATGDVHSWNIVKVGGKWYHTDSTYNDGEGSKNKYLLMTQDERSQTIHNIETSFKATNVKFDKSMALPYTLK